MELSVANPPGDVRTEDAILKSIRSKLRGNRQANASTDAGEITRLLDRIRQQIAEQAPAATGTAPSTLRAPLSPEASRIQLELEAALVAHRQFGNLNPRLSGVHNSAIQLAKKVMRRSLTWYTRPLHQFQSAILRSLQNVSTIIRTHDNALQKMNQKLDDSAFTHEEQIAGMRDEIASLRSELRAVKQELHQVATARVKKSGAP